MFFENLNNDFDLKAETVKMECWTTFQLPGGLPRFISLDFSWKSCLYTMDEAVFELDLVEDMLWTDSSFEGKWNSVSFRENLW